MHGCLLFSSNPTPFRSITLSDPRTNKFFFVSPIANYRTVQAFYSARTCVLSMFARNSLSPAANALLFPSPPTPLSLRLSIRSFSFSFSFFLYSSENPLEARRDRSGNGIAPASASTLVEPESDVIHVQSGNRPRRCDNGKSAPNFH